MDIDEIEKEVKRENDRKWQASEAEAKREHELKMARARRDGVIIEGFVGSMIVAVLLTWIVAGTTCHYIGESDARENDINATDMKRDRNKCQERLDALLSARAGKGEQ